MQFDFPQSTFYCVLFSAVGGAIEVLATALLAWKDANEVERGVKWSRPARILALAGNIFLQVTSSILGNLISTWFGPVSLVGPMFLCAQLFANMIVFGYLLGLESFNKDMRIGTLIVLIACVMLPIVGPTSQEGQDVAALLEQWHSLFWSGSLVVGMLVSAVLLFVLNLSKLSEAMRMGLLLVARATAFSVNLTVSKVMVLEISALTLLVCIVLKIVSGLVITGALIVQASAVAQKKFVPLNASCLIVVNAITGMIIWQDYNVVQDWVGYSCVFIQLILGNYLLMGDISMLSPENTKYGRAKALKELRASMVIMHRDQHSAISELTSLEDEDRAPPNPCGYMSMEGANLEAPQAAAGIQASRQRRRPSSTREAWSSVYGIDPDDATKGIHRRKTIFFIDEEGEQKEDEEEEGPERAEGRLSI